MGTQAAGKIALNPRGTDATLIDTAAALSLFLLTSHMCSEVHGALALSFLVPLPSLRSLSRLSFFVYYSVRQTIKLHGRESYRLKRKTNETRKNNEDTVPWIPVYHELLTGGKRRTPEQRKCRRGCLSSWEWGPWAGCVSLDCWPWKQAPAREGLHSNTTFLKNKVQDLIANR